MVKIRNTLLLVEDNLDDERLSTRAILASGVDCQLLVIRNGREVIELLSLPEALVPDLIVLDFHLPGEGGLSVLRALREQPKTRHVPVVMLSSMDLESVVHSCLNEGANSCVQKPQDPRLYSERVIQIVRYWLTVDRQAEREVFSR